MNKITKRSIRDRVRAIVKAAQGKPEGHIHFGLELKHCMDCERGNCNNCGKAMYFDRVSRLPDCNTCGKQITCEYAPAWGETTRINCPLWKEDENK